MKVYDAGAFVQPPPELVSLFALTAPLSFFLLPEWFWLIDQFGSEPESRLELTTDEKLSMGLPLLRTGRSRTQGCTNLYTCEYDLLGSHDQPDGVRSFVKECAARTAFDYIRLEGIPANSPSLAFLREGFIEAGFVAKSYFGWGTWFEDTRGLTFADYVNRRPAILRNTWKRKSQSLQRLANWDIKILEPSEDIAPYVAAYEAVHNASWKSPEPYPEFLRQLIHVAAEKGALRMGLLRIDHTPAAAQFWLVWGGRAVIFKLAYDGRFSRFSPGTVLTMHMMESVLEADRPQEISFGRGDDAYKKLWLSERREYWGIEAANPHTAAGFLKAMQLRAALYRNRVMRAA